MSCWPEPFAPDEFAGQICLVTCAARGIGPAIAARVAGLGGSVIVSDINGIAAEQHAGLLRRESKAAMGVRLDVRDTAEIDRVVGAVERDLGPVDVVVNNAGLFNLTE